MYGRKHLFITCVSKMTLVVLKLWIKVLGLSAYHTVKELRQVWTHLFVQVESLRSLAGEKGLVLLSRIRWRKGLVFGFLFVLFFYMETFS